MYLLDNDSCIADDTYAMFHWLRKSYFIVAGMSISLHPEVVVYDEISQIHDYFINLLEYDGLDGGQLW